MVNDEYFIEIDYYFNKMKQYREESKSILSGIAGENLTKEDLFFISALNRRVQFIDGMIDLLSTRNLTCAGILVRTQLDNLMRVFAAFISKDRKSFIDETLNGKPIRNMRDNQDKMMTDFHLKKRISEYYPEIEEIYDRSSGYVHLSNMAFHECFWTDEEDTIKFSVGAPLREELNIILIECAEAFCHITEIEFGFFRKIITSKIQFDENMKHNNFKG